MSNWNVYYNADSLKCLYSKTNFNYKNDIKNLSEKQLQDIAEEVGNQLQIGLKGGSSHLYFGKNRNASYAKIRVVDVSTDKGKSSGFRCIVLVDFVHCAAFMLHLYKHGKNSEIQKEDKQRLRSLVDEYIESMNIK